MPEMSQNVTFNNRNDEKSDFCTPRQVPFENASGGKTIREKKGNTKVIQRNCKGKYEGITKRSISPTKRLSGSLAFAMHAYKNGIQIIRTHDVFETKQAIICQETMN